MVGRGDRGGPRHRRRRGHRSRGIAVPQRAGACRSGAGLGHQRITHKPGHLRRLRLSQAHYATFSALSPAGVSLRAVRVPTIPFVPTAPRARGWARRWRRWAGTCRCRNLRWDDDYVLVDIDAAPTDPKAPHAKPEEVRFGLYGALSHPMEAGGLGSCDDAMNKVHDITLAAVGAPRPAHRHGVPGPAERPQRGPRGVRLLAARPDSENHCGLRRGVSGRTAADQRQRHRRADQDHQPVGLARRRHPGDQGTTR